MVGRYLTLPVPILENTVSVNVYIAPQQPAREFSAHKPAGVAPQEVTNMAMPAHFDPASKFLQQSRPAVGEVLSTLGRAQTMTTPRPDHLSVVRFQKPSRLRVTFADSKTFSLPVKRLQMPVDRIDWPTAAASHDGATMTVREIGGSRDIAIDAGAVRYMVDEAYAARAKAALNVLHANREAGNPIWRKCSSLRADAGGVVRVGNTRVSLDVVVEQYEGGMTPEGIVLAYDSLTLDDVRAVIAFYAQNREQVRAYLARREGEAEVLRAMIEAERPRISREELLARRNA
jgi:uncharacterized protein (DUF433 family)